MAFLHGIETTTTRIAGVPVTTVRSGVIGLVGIAPIGAKNTLKIINSPTEAVNTFGAELTGFSIPQALKNIYDQGSATVVVLNVYDEATHAVSVAAETQVVANGKVKTAFQPVGTTFTVTNTAGTTTYVDGTDYTRDVFGNVTILSSAISNGASLKITYKKLDAAALTAAHIIGTAGATPTGIQAFVNTKPLFGFDPKILIAPGHLSLAGVPEALIVAAEKYRGVCILEAPNATDYSTAIAGRGASGTVPGWKTGNKRAILCWPNWKAVNSGTGITETRPASQFLAGLMANLDNTAGFWFSPSNREVKGVIEPEVPVTFGLSDQTSQANLLNAAGIVTCINAGGFKTWGNRNASYPASTDVETFIPVLRTSSTIDESVETATLQYLDKPITQGWIDAIRNTVDGYLNTLFGRGAVLGGKCSYDTAKNPPIELAAGHVTFDVEYLPPIPGERITFDRFLNINYLNSLV